MYKVGDTIKIIKSGYGKNAGKLLKARIFRYDDTERPYMSVVFEDGSQEYGYVDLFKICEGDKCE